MKRRLPLGSEGSDQGMTRTGSSAEASTDHSASINDYLSACLKAEGWLSTCVDEQQAKKQEKRNTGVSPLRFASVEMTYFFTASVETMVGLGGMVWLRMGYALDRMNRRSVCS